MQALDDVKSWMTFFGWRDGGGPGSIKQDADGRAIARHGDATWIEDVQTCIEKAERQRLVAEIERRESLRASLK